MANIVSSSLGLDVLQSRQCKHSRVRPGSVHDELCFLTYPKWITLDRKVHKGVRHSIVMADGDAGNVSDIVAAWRRRMCPVTGVDSGLSHRATGES
eukprot:6206354-Pleurochrysis_carterae.AAC.5